MPNANRRHALFICSEIGDAVSGLDIDVNRPTVVNTDAGKMSSVNGTFGGLNFGVPVRLTSKAGMARHWGAQAFRTADAESKVFPQKFAPTVREGLSNNFSMLGLRSLRQAEPKSTVNGVVCMAYTDDELAAARRFYARFGNAVLARLPKDYFEEVSWQILPDVQWIYCVVTTDSAFEPPTYTSPILQTYLDGICKDFLAYGEDFCLEFLGTTRNWSIYWLDNRIEDLTLGNDDAITEPEKEAIDGILKASEVDFAQRKNISGYSLKRPQLETGGIPKLATVGSGKIEQANTKYFCFGMGSLINTPSRVGTAGKVAQSAIPVSVTADYEFCPCWNFQNRAGGSQLTAGGMVMRKDKRNKNPKAETAGVIYPGPTNDEKMKAQDEREVGYTRYDIQLKFIRSLNWCQIPEGIVVFQYVPNTELPDDHKQRAKDSFQKPTPRAPFPPREYPLSQTYVDVCIKGCLEYSEEFAAAWIAGFVGWPTKDNPHWLNDRPTARTPWVHESRYREVDEVLMSEIPESFACRRLPAEYALFYKGKKIETDVSYISYSKEVRKPVLAANQIPNLFIFEYGERISAKQWRKIITQTDIEQGIACRLKEAAGYRRSFCLHVDSFGGSTVPAMMEDGKNARIVNGVLYAAPQKWLKSGHAPDAKDDKFIGKNMTRVELSPKDFHVLANFMQIPLDAKIFTYAVEKPQAPSYDYPIRQTLVDAILAGCMEHSVDEDFTAEWVDTTDGWKFPGEKCYWLNDRLIARRPWVALGGSYKVFDRLVYESPFAPKGVLLERRLPVEFPLNM